MSNNLQSSPQSVLRTDLSLSEQLKITDREIKYRKELLNFGQEEVNFLVACQEHMQTNLDSIVAQFYLKQRAIPQVDLVIGDAETFKRLHHSMKRYIMELFSGFYDKEYVDKRLRIGKIHQRIGVTPTLYITAIAQLEELLQQSILQVSMHNKVCGECEGRRLALHKLLMFDVELVFDTYTNSLVSEVEAAKSQVERYAESLEETVAQRTSQLEALSKQDGLTGLLNQRSFYELLRLEVARAERSRLPVSLVYFDLNRFKALNDSEGHKAGDALLELVGKILLKTIRAIDFGFRYGGDEFCIILPGGGEHAARELCERLSEAFSKADNKGVAFSMGIAQMGPDYYTDFNALVKAADANMYLAKAESKKEPGYYIRSGIVQPQEGVKASQDGGE